MDFYFAPPPHGLTVDKTTELVVTVLVAVVCLMWIAKAAWDWRRGVGALGVVLLVGGLVPSLHEANLDELYQVWHARNGWMGYETIGPVPLWCVLAYVLYFGGATYVLYTRVQSGAKARDLWMYFAVFLALDLAAEIPLTALKFYDYYGNAPLKIAGVSLYFPFVNAPSIFLMVVLLVRVPHLWTGWRMLTIPVMQGSAFASTEAFTGWPAFVVLHVEGLAGWVSEIGGLLCVAIGVWLLSLLISLVASDGRLNPKSVHAHVAVPASPRDVNP